MSTKKTTKSVEPIYVTRTVNLPLSESEMTARQKELPLVISAEVRLAMRRKSMLAELKTEGEDLNKQKARLVEEINSGKRREDLRCLKQPVISERRWHVIHPTTGEIIERFEMGWEEYERLKNAACAAEAEATAETQLDLPLKGAGVIITPPQPPLLGLPAVSVPMPPVGEQLPVLAIAAKDRSFGEAKHVDEDVIEGEVVVAPGCYMGYHADRFAWPAESTNGMLYHALHRFSDRNGGLSEDLVEPNWWQDPDSGAPTDAELFEYLSEAWYSRDMAHSSGNKYDVKLVAMWNGKDGFRVKLSENCFDDEGRSTGSRSFQRSGTELVAAIRGLLFAPVAENSSTEADSPSTEAPEKVDEKSDGEEKVVQGENLTPYLLPLVLNEEPRKNEYGSISSVCTTLEQMLSDLKELETDTRHAGHYVFSLAALRAGLGFLFIRQWTGQKSAWTQAINLASTITGAPHTDFPKALEMIPAFAAHLEATKTTKNPKAGLKSWNPKGDAEELQKAVQQGNEAISALFGAAQTTGELVDEMASRLV